MLPGRVPIVSVTQKIVMLVSSRSRSIASSEWLHERHFSTSQAARPAGESFRP